MLDKCLTKQKIAIMFYDYRMSNLQFGKIETGSNKGKVFMTAVARNTKFRMDCTTITLLPSNGNDEIIEMCRSVFPKGEKHFASAPMVIEVKLDMDELGCCDE